GDAPRTPSPRNTPTARDNSCSRTTSKSCREPQSQSAQSLLSASKIANHAARDYSARATPVATYSGEPALSSISVEIEFGGVSHCGFLRHAFVPQPASSSPRLVHYERHPRSRENGPDSAGDAEKNLPLSWWYANGAANTVGIASRPTPAANPAETSRPSPEPRNASAGQSSRPISAAGSPARLQRSTRTPAETSAAATTADAASVLPD